MFGRYIFTLLLSFMVFATVTSAKSSDLFVNYLGEIIFEDCSRNDINIKEGFISLKSDIENSNKPLTTIKSGSYTLVNLTKIIQILGEREPFDQYFAGCGSNDNSGFSMGKNGCKILSCSGHTLDINQYEYFWDGERIDLPREEFTAIYGDNIETYGDESPVTTGDSSPIIQNNNGPVDLSNRNIWIQMFFSKGTIIGTLIGFLLKVLYDIIVRHRRNR